MSREVVYMNFTFSHSYPRKIWQASSFLTTLKNKEISHITLQSFLRCVSNAFSSNCSVNSISCPTRQVKTFLTHTETQGMVYHLRIISLNDRFDEMRGWNHHRKHPGYDFVLRLLMIMIHPTKHVNIFGSQFLLWF